MSETPLRVLHLIDTLGRGGAEMLLVDVCRHAGEAALDLSVLASGGGPLEADLRSIGASLSIQQRRWPIDPVLLNKITELCREQSIDVIHSHQPVSTLHALAVRRTTRVPVVHSIHGFTEDIKNKLSLRRVLTHADANIVVSESMQKMLLQREWISSIPRCHVVYNGVSTDRLHSQRGLLRAELGLKADDLVIGMVGNFYGVKDQLTICRAMESIVQRIPNVHCVFAGRADNIHLYDACRETVLENGCANRVHFLGGRTDVAAILTDLDLFVFSTLADTFGMALVEAQLSGVACAVSDIEVMQEVTGKGKSAALFRSQDAHNLANVVTDLLSKAEKRHELAARAKKFAEENFSIHAHVRALRAVYETLCPQTRLKDIPLNSRYSTQFTTKVP